MSDYSKAEMIKMQEDAKKRVMEMRKRAGDIAQSFGEEQKKHSEASVNGVPDEVRAVSCPVEYDEKPHMRKNGQSPVSGHENKSAQNNNGLLSAPEKFFGIMNEDEAERMFILSLCLLLLTENSDSGLLLSLMYLLT